MTERLKALLLPLLVCAGITACGGGGGAPASPEVVRITLAGMPSAPPTPMQSVQLSASATYSDGTVKDVTAISPWQASDSRVLTVTPSSYVTATGPGKAETGPT